MSKLRFNHVFLVLMLASGFMAFVLPPSASNALRGKIDVLFAPVAVPLRRVAMGVSGQLQARADNTPADLSTATPAVRAEIERLRAQVASLTVQLDELKRIHADRQLVGDAQKYASPFKVLGGDRDSLSLQGSSADGLAVGQAAVHRDSLVGRITVAGSGGAQLRLITDRGFRMAGLIGRFKTAADGKVEFVKVVTPPLLVEGRGGDTLSVMNLTIQQVREAGLAQGDVVYLSDPDDWPLPINGYFIGQITQLDEQPKAPLFAEITIAPKLNLRQLREVMVVTGKAPAAAASQSQTRPPADAGQQQRNAHPSAETKAPARRRKGGN